MKNNNFDLITIGAGAAGIIASIIAAKSGKKVLLLEKLPQIAAKLKATGGGRCNLTNTLSNEEFMSRFGRNGRFMQDALRAFDHKALIAFFATLGVATHAPDGYRVFPTSHSSSTILEALADELKKQNITLLTSQKVIGLLQKDDMSFEVHTINDIFQATNIIIATGGLGYPTLGAEGDGFTLAQALGHTITELFPAMMPLHTKETWVKNCRADTIPKAELQVAMKKHKNIKAQGDLIFTNHGIRGPVVLDFAREITPLLEKYGEVPLVMNLLKGMDEDKIHTHLKEHAKENRHAIELLETLLPTPLAKEMLLLAEIELSSVWKNITGLQKERLIKTLAATPLTITGHDGFKMAMITRGGVSLKEIDPKTMQSKIVKGLYFCGEVMDIDGPCGGYNLQWSFSSGALAGELLS
ncbi:MAG: NAD(P)/FAD-dependent oxidoreductase [Sulfurimonadaceae bacterium]|jgi:predicted Rossmann fold flavoprotein|nr:NAD(P)/FAD-dependent oxidoreductase [Sulfurimonadaceae bacterium]